MEALMLLVLTVAIGYMVNKLDKLESKFNELENKVIEMDAHLPRRKGDTF